MAARGLWDLLGPGAAHIARGSMPGRQNAAPQPAMCLGLHPLTAAGRRRRRRRARLARLIRLAPPAAGPGCPLQDFTVNAVGKDDKLDMALKGAYSANKYSVVATLAQTGKV